MTTFGESHGEAIGCVVDGCPPGLALSESDIQPDLDRRRPGVLKHTSQRQETDQVKILSGTFEGKTTGTPIALMIPNQNAKPQHYEENKNKFRPGHADYTYYKKYGIRDHRGGGRASARETASRVAAGAIAKKYLKQFGIDIQAALIQIGNIQAEKFEIENAKNNSMYFSDLQKIAECEAYIENLRREGDSIGSKILIVAKNIMLGLGEPVFDKLDADIAFAMMSIPAVKAVEIGAGTACVQQRGSEHRDEITPEGFLTNHSGGTLGGISSGQDIIVTISVKPAPSIRIPGKTIDLDNRICDIVTTGRHDPCVGIRAVPVSEAMLALVLIDHLLRRGAHS